MATVYRNSRVAPLSYASEEYSGVGFFPFMNSGGDAGLPKVLTNTVWFISTGAPAVDPPEADPATAIMTCLKKAQAQWDSVNAGVPTPGIDTSGVMPGIFVFYINVFVVAGGYAAVVGYCGSPGDLSGNNATAVTGEVGSGSGTASQDRFLV